jgi:capsular polysaccharide biosynthesis protein
MMRGPWSGVMRRWWWLLLAGAALGAGAAILAIGATPPVYRASSTLLVFPPGEATLNQSFMRTYAQMAVHDVVLDRVRQTLELNVSAAHMRELVTARPLPETQLIEVVAESNDAGTARDIANTTARVFVDQESGQTPAGPAGPSLRIGQPAVTPDQPIGPRPLQPVLLGTVLGAVLGLIGARLLGAPRSLPAHRRTLPAGPAIALGPETTVPMRAETVPVVPIIPVIEEHIGPLDLLRGVAVAGLACGLLLIPVMRNAGLQPPAIQLAPIPLPSAVGALPADVTQRGAPSATTSPPVAAVAQAPTATDEPLTPAAFSSAGEAEIAGATSAGPDRGDQAPTTESPAVAPPPAPAPQAPAAGVPPARAPSFEARFDGSQTAWPNDPQGSARFENGAYRVSPIVPGQFAAIGAPFDQPLRDVVVTAAFQKTGGPPGGVYGIMVRDVGPPRREGQVGDFYVLGIDDRGQFGVWRRDGDRWIDLVPLTPSDAIRSGTQANELAIQAIDDRLTLTVNGTDVATVLGAQARAGTVGIYVGGDANDVLVTRFEAQAATAAAASPVPSPNEAPAPAAGASEVAGVAESREREARAATTRAPAGFTAAFLREAPTSASAPLSTLRNGTPLEILPETAVGDGFTWLHARTQDGLEGWIVATAVSG